jgi:hypothetical protein
MTVTTTVSEDNASALGAVVADGVSPLSLMTHDLFPTDPFIAANDALLGTNAAYSDLGSPIAPVNLGASPVTTETHSPDAFSSLLPFSRHH